MAIINNGPLTNGIRGKVGDVIFQMVNGTQIVRAMPPSISDPNTPLQQVQRNAFTQAVVEWRDLDVHDRELWNFYAYLRSNRQARIRQRRVDGTPKPENGTNFDGHAGAVRQKSWEADYRRVHDPGLPPPIDLPDPPPFAKTKNIPPVSVQVLLAKGSEGAVWNPDPGGLNRDGLWWYFDNPVTPTPDSRARVWVQPPYPIHRQRITAEDPTFPDTWVAVPGVLAHDGYMWAWKLQVGASKIRIIEPDTGGPPWTLTTPFVWKYQHDIQDATYQSTKGSAVWRFYLPDGIADGLWQVWPSLQMLAGPP